MHSNTSPLGRHRFNAADQAHFGQLSGDLNPLHMDALAARRLIAGAPVVHGIHTLLRTLENIPDSEQWSGSRIECEFLNPVCVGDVIEISKVPSPGDSTIYVASADAVACTRVTLASASAGREAMAVAAGARASPRLAAPMQRTPQDWVGERLHLSLPSESFSAAFPGACAHWGERRVAALALLSYFVGMVCPGQHSVFAGLQAQAGAASDGLDFHIRSYNARYKQFVIGFEGCIHGEIKAFVRPPAQPQQVSTDLHASVDAQAFAGRHAWVIGGSRGLGEMTAKILGAGGALVTLTYSAGAGDALRVAEDINSAGRGPAVVRSLDIIKDDLASWVQSNEPPDAVFYFATPRIFRKGPAGFQPALLAEFMDFYVFRLEALCRALDEHPHRRPFALFHPSSVAVDERPKGIAEYAMAKAAAEILVAEMPRWMRQMRVVNRRLPRLATDQTAVLFGPSTPSNLDTLLPIVCEVMGVEGP